VSSGCEEVVGKWLTFVRSGDDVPVFLDERAVKRG
jgi:hypothetical protein